MGTHSVILQLFLRKNFSMKIVFALVLAAACVAIQASPVKRPEHQPAGEQKPEHRPEGDCFYGMCIPNSGEEKPEPRPEGLAPIYVLRGRRSSGEEKPEPRPEGLAPIYVLRG